MEASIEVIFQILTYGGDALGRLPDGRAVFVPYALPGERARIRLVEEKRGHARGELEAILSPAPERVLPRCVHFGHCGGCHYQHIAYQRQLELKTIILRDQLERIGGLTDPPVHPIQSCPAPFNYRNHIQFHLDPAGKLGYALAGSTEIFAIEECHLPEETLNEIWPQLDFEALADIQRVGLRLGAGEDVQLILESSNLEAPDLSVEELPLSVVHISPAGPLVLAGSQAVVMEILGRPFRVSAGSFFQVNTWMAEAMVTHVLEGLSRYASLGAETVVLEIYCGVGLFSAFLAERARKVIGIETSSSAVDDFVINLDEFENVEIYEAPAEDVIPQLDLQPQIILVDPPRAGLDRRVLDGILHLQAPLLVYVSCDPATLGRDARRLTAGGYQLTGITPFDLFPQTYHIESISFWARKMGEP